MNAGEYEGVPIGTRAQEPAAPRRGIWEDEKQHELAPSERYLDMNRREVRWYMLVRPGPGIQKPSTLFSILLDSNLSYQYCIIDILQSILIPNLHRTHDLVEITKKNIKNHQIRHQNGRIFYT